MPSAARPEPPQPPATDARLQREHVWEAARHEFARQSRHYTQAVTAALGRARFRHQLTMYRPTEPTRNPGNCPSGFLCVYKGINYEVQGGGVLVQRLGLGRQQPERGKSLEERLLLTSPGDVNGDGRPDLIARNSSTGAVYLYKGTSARKLSARVKLYDNWETYRKIVGVGDVNGNGGGDLLARDKSNTLWRYDGNAPTASRRG
ncbi:VCBS repeat-containing protein [Streptomyces canus]|uniref:FG-GAP repeat domain-containing protein n=1 Tax=Streptomyces canus TaxID=58343 RepID=UPI0033BA6A4C